MEEQKYVKQECIPVGCLPTAAVAATRCQYQGVYDVTSCLVPCPFQQVGLYQEGVVSVRRGWSLSGGGETDACDNITFPCSW